MLVKRSDKKTNFVLPIYFDNGYSTFWYYDNEYFLFKAYNQLKKINCNFAPGYPLVFRDEVNVC